MKRLLNPRQVKFALALLDAPNISAAYREAYGCHDSDPRVVANAASKLRQDPRIRELYSDLVRERARAGMRSHE